MPTQPGIGEWIDALNGRPWKSNCRLLLTSRPFPKGKQVMPPLCFLEYTVGGLMTQEGLALFRLRGIQAVEADLQRAVISCDGHPLSLVLLIDLIQLYEIPLADLLAEQTLWIGDIATNLLDAVFQRLTEEQRAVLRAFSLYRMAVPVAALSSFLTQPTTQLVLLSLRSLLVQQVIQPAGNGHYRVHAVVGRYVQMHFAQGDQQANQQALRAAHMTAAHYYLEQVQVSALPREQRRGVNDIQGIIEAVWQYTQAAQWQKAYALVEREQLFYDLSIWGGYIQLLDLCQWFLPQNEWQPEPNQIITIYQYLGRAYSIHGKMKQALDYYQQALSISREAGDHEGEGSTLHNIGSVYYDLNRWPQALEYYQQALTIRRELGDRGSEAMTLNNIGSVYNALGNKKQALDYYQQALTISRKVRNRLTEGMALNNIGGVYNALGNKQQALDYYQQSLTIRRELDDRWGEAATVYNIGRVHNAMDNLRQALDYYQQSLSIRQEVGDRWGEAVTLNNIGKIYDRLGDPQRALEYYQQALTILREVNDHEREGTTLNDIGEVHDRLGDPQQALEYYQQALSILSELGNLRDEGMMFSSLGRVYNAQDDPQRALEYYQQALTILREVGDRRSEGTILNNIGSIYDRLGDPQQALDYYQQSLSIRQEVGDRWGEAVTLNNIGEVHDRLDNPQRALDYYWQALPILQDLGDLEGEGIVLNSIGVLSLGHRHYHQYDLALAAFLLAKQCFEKVSLPLQHTVEERIVALRLEVGQEQFAALCALVEPRVQERFEQGVISWLLL